MLAKVRMLTLFRRLRSIADVEMEASHSLPGHSRQFLGPRGPGVFPHHEDGLAVVDADGVLVDLL